ncbi:cell wall hydrolase [Zooshikella sp. RANM57]|uniref:cell wall hydrolase n=1 Tax=Zooshikella sp. RANM57 TaxID=3425863 RepID=UPI003D6DDF42
MGQLAVAEVTLARVQASSWPTTLCAVVYQRHQFAWTADSLTDEMLEPEARQLAYLLADLVLSGHQTNYTKGATHYHTVNIKPYWASELQQTVIIKNHIFYK